MGEDMCWLPQLQELRRFHATFAGKGGISAVELTTLHEPASELVFAHLSKASAPLRLP